MHDSLKFQNDKIACINDGTENDASIETESSARLHATVSVTATRDDRNIEYWRCKKKNSSAEAGASVIHAPLPADVSCVVLPTVGEKAKCTLGPTQLGILRCG
jgi:hypothetical protein